MVPAFGGLDDAIRVCGPDERFWVAVALGDEAFDGGLNLDERAKHTPSQPALALVRCLAHTATPPKTLAFQRPLSLSPTPIAALPVPPPQTKRSRTRPVLLPQHRQQEAAQASHTLSVPPQESNWKLTSTQAVQVAISHTAAPPPPPTR